MEPVGALRAPSLAGWIDDRRRYPPMPRLDWQFGLRRSGAEQIAGWLGCLRGCARRTGGRCSKVFDQPPKQLRILRYRYRMTPPGAARWWAREPLGVYLKPVYLSGQGKVTFAQPADVMRPDP